MFLGSCAFDWSRFPAPTPQICIQEYKDDDSVLVAEVDCVGTGKAKCKELDIQAYPEVKYLGSLEMQKRL